MRNRWILTTWAASVFASILVLSGAFGTPADKHSTAADEIGAHERAIDATYREWVDATNAKDIEKWTSFLSPGAVFLPPDHASLDDTEVIRRFYSELFLDERFALDCHQERVEVAAAEDLAWSIGHCEATLTSPEGGEVRQRSKWVKVWERTPTGEWKGKVNSWSSTGE